MPCWKPNRFLLASCMLMACVGCSGEETSLEDVVVDSLHAEVLIDLHLADARAEVTGEPRDSLRQLALAARELDSLALEEIFDRYAQNPEEAVAIYEHATEHLVNERRGQ